MVKELVRNKVYMFFILALSGLYFVITGLQYWMSDYLQVVLLVPHEEVYTFYATTCFTAPFAGVIVGGVAFSASGGYNSQKSGQLVKFISFCCVLVALPVPFLD